MLDLTKTIIPKTDQLNYDSFIGGSTLTIKVTKVSLLAEKDQPIAIAYENDNGRPFKPCKSMRRVLVQLWGGNGEDYIGRSMTLFGDPTVKFGGANVGGIRISHLSHIAEPVTLALTASKAVRKPYVVRPLVIKQERAEQAVAASPAGQPASAAGEEPGDVEYISADQSIELGDLLAAHADLKMELIRKYGSLAKIPAVHYARVKSVIVAKSETA